MKKIKITAVVVFLLMLFTFILSCDPDFFGEGCHSHIQLTNNGNVDICTDANYYGYPDTTINNINPLRRGQKVSIGENGHASCIGGGGLCIESTFDEYQYLSIFIFDANFMEQHLKDDGFKINESMALQRYDFTLEDLNSLNWTVPYPPDERMKNMKMYPPYGK